MLFKHRYYSEFNVYVWVWELKVDGVSVCSVLAPHGELAMADVMFAFKEYPRGAELEAVRLYRKCTMGGQIYG